MRTGVLIGMVVLALHGAAHAEGLKLPDTLPSADALATEGWLVESSTDGELNGDALADQVVVLLERKGTDRKRALVVLFGQPRGYRVAGSNTSLLACYECLGVKGGDAQPEVELARGILAVVQHGGSRYWYDSVHKFRYEPRARRMLLIGLDEASGDGLTGEESYSSHNFVTARSVTVHTPAQRDEDGNELRVKTARREEKLPRRPLQSLEQVRSAFGQ